MQHPPDPGPLPSGRGFVFPCCSSPMYQGQRKRLPLKFQLLNGEIMDITQVLSNMVLVDIIIGGSTGERTLEADDFIREVGKMLSPGTFSWVSKARTDAKRIILRVGAARRVDNRVRGYFVPLDRAQAVSDELRTLRDTFQTQKAEFLQELPNIVEEWAANPQNAVEIKPGLTRADLIRNHAPKASDLDKLLRFAMSATQIQSSQFFGEDDALHTEVTGLPGQAALEIAEDVKKSWKGAAGGKTTSRVLGLVRRIRQKADSMGILSPKFEHLREACDRVLKQMPQTGAIEGLEFMQISALLEFCSRPENILAEQSMRFDPLDVEMEVEAPAQQALAELEPVTPAPAESIPSVPAPVSQPLEQHFAFEF
jgi:hypothetical protein